MVSIDKKFIADPAFQTWYGGLYFTKPNTAYAYRYGSRFEEARHDNLTSTFN